jgi:hypothetical protein
MDETNDKLGELDEFQREVVQKVSSAIGLLAAMDGIRWWNLQKHITDPANIKLIAKDWDLGEIENYLKGAQRLRFYCESEIEQAKQVKNRKE